MHQRDKRLHVVFRVNGSSARSWKGDRGWHARLRKERRLRVEDPVDVVHCRLDGEGDDTLGVRVGKRCEGCEHGGDLRPRAAKFKRVVIPTLVARVTGGKRGCRRGRAAVPELVIGHPARVESRDANGPPSSPFHATFWGPQEEGGALGAAKVKRSPGSGRIGEARPAPTVEVRTLRIRRARVGLRASTIRKPVSIGLPAAMVHPAYGVNVMRRS